MLKMLHIFSIFNIKMATQKFTNFHKFLKNIYLFLERGEGREKESERNNNVWLPFAAPHNQGPGL